jgi:hypothetical protein
VEVLSADYTRPDIQCSGCAMDKSEIAFWLTIIGTICWGICFLWMHRISRRQNSLLDQLKAQGKRIEAFSRIEHDLIKEVHPQVGEIKEGVDAIAASVKEGADSKSAS